MHSPAEQQRTFFGRLVCAAVCRVRYRPDTESRFHLPHKMHIELAVTPAQTLWLEQLEVRNSTNIIYWTADFGD